MVKFEETRVCLGAAAAAVVYTDPTPATKKGIADKAEVEESTSDNPVSTSSYTIDKEE